MKVLLVNCVNNLLTELAPTGLMSISTYLKSKGHTVMLCDLACGHNYDLFLNAFKPDVVAISTMTNFAYTAYEHAKVACLKGIYTVLGGVHPSAVPQEALNFCDAVVIGEGEITLSKLIETREKGVFLGEQMTSLDEVPMLDYSIVEMDHYTNTRKRQHNSIWSFADSYDRVANTITSRGCPFLCSYCHNSYTKIKVRYRDINNIVEELKLLKNTYKVDTVHLVDDNFLLDKKRASKLCSTLEQEKLGLYMSCSARSSSITQDVLDMLKNAGFLQIAFGFESGSQRILDILNKGTTVENNANAIELCNKNEFTIQGSFMFGNPTETLEEMKETLKFIKTHYMDGGLGTFITTPYPATKLWEWAVNNNKIPENTTWDKLAFHKYNGIVLHNVPVAVFYDYFNIVMNTANQLFNERYDNRMLRVKNMKDRLRK